MPLNKETKTNQIWYCRYALLLTTPFRGGTHGVIVTVVGNGNIDTSSNPGQG